MRNRICDEIVREENIKSSIDTDEVVESFARMTEEKRNQFVRSIVKKWPDLASSISNKIDQEIYDVKNYG